MKRGIHKEASDLSWLHKLENTWNTSMILMALDRGKPCFEGGLGQAPREHVLVSTFGMPKFDSQILCEDGPSHRGTHQHRANNDNTRKVLRNIATWRHIEGTNKIITGGRGGRRPLRQTHSRSGNRNKTKASETASLAKSAAILTQAETIKTTLVSVRIAQLCSA